MGRLDGRVALITGAGEGIGRGIARRFATEGAAIVIAELDVERGQRVADEVEALGAKCLFVETDVKERAAVFASVGAATETFGRLDVLVNNAIALAPRVFLEDKTDEMFEHSLRVGLWANLWAMQAAFPTMKAQGGGSIINFRSLDGELGHWLQSDYNASKEAIGGLTRSAAAEWGRYNIRVNAITPAAAGAGHEQLSREDPERLAKIESSVPLLRIGDPERDIGGAALFLATDDSCYVTGVTLYVDGGLHLPRYDTKPYDLLAARADGPS
ncbi:MAG: short-chain dehydrogenase [Acidimicrobiales bacterium]|nr:short-chain dehydrogenase [Acidimicrobiales bacterium]